MDVKTQESKPVRLSSMVYVYLVLIFLYRLQYWENLERKFAAAVLKRKRKEMSALFNTGKKTVGHSLKLIRHAYERKAFVSINTPHLDICVHTVN